MDIWNHHMASEQEQAGGGPGAVNGAGGRGGPTPPPTAPSAGAGALPGTEPNLQSERLKGRGAGRPEGVDDMFANDVEDDMFGNGQGAADGAVVRAEEPGGGQRRGAGRGLADAYDDAGGGRLAPGSGVQVGQRVGG
jgi:hypothetical protein